MWKVPLEGSHTVFMNTEIGSVSEMLFTSLELRTLDKVHKPSDPEVTLRLV
jgi:hypothetical protein